MDADDVAKYLLENPIFFEDHTELLTQLYLPNPHGGQAIALADRQVQALREEHKALKTKMQELIQFGEENDAISAKMHRLVLSLLPVATLSELLAELHYGLREGLAVPHTALRIWSARNMPALLSGDAADREELNSVSDHVKEYASGLSRAFCGPSGNVEVVNWFGDPASHVRSVAHIPLHDSAGACNGLLAMGSEDVLRFFPDMGIVYLQRLGELTSAALRRFV